MMEFLDRGIGEILYEKGENLLLGAGNVMMLSTETKDTLLKMLQTTSSYMAIAVTEDFVKDVLVEDYHMQAGPSCYQACYTRKVSLPVRHRDIRCLGPEHLEYLVTNCNQIPVAYLSKRLEAGAFWGAFEEDVLVGFVGSRAEGSMGMLFVEEKYRRKGIGAALESHMINLQVANGQTPYCQIAEGNTAAFALQEKLGLYVAEEPMWWLYKV